MTQLEGVWWKEFVWAFDASVPLLKSYDIIVMWEFDPRPTHV